MTLSLEISSLSTRLEKYPLSRLMFITIRDPTQKSKWCEISKVRSWIRRYSTDYVIVRGLVGGIHYHILAGILPNKTVKCQKGIHFNIKSLSDPKSTTVCYPTPEDVQDRLKVLYYRNQKYEDLTIDIDIECQCIISQINAMIKKYWKSRKAKASKRKCLTKKSENINNVIAYLQKNLDENVEPELYVNYWHT